MREFEAIAEVALRGFDIPDPLREELLNRIAHVVFWDRKLSYATYQQYLGNLRIDLQEAIAPKTSGSEYQIGIEIRKIRREFRSEVQPVDWEQMEKEEGV